MTRLQTMLASWVLAVICATGAIASAPLTPAWVFPREGRMGPVVSSPTVYRNVVYVGSDDGKLYALHATGPEAGTLLPGFPITLDGAIKGRPAVYGDFGSERVYVVTVAGSLYAFALDGTPAWYGNPQRVCPGVPIVSTPAVRGNYVYVTASNGRIIRRQTADGSAAGGLTYGRVVQTFLPGAQRVPPARTDLAVANANAFFSTGRVTVVSPGPLGTALLTEFTYSGKNTAVRPHRLLNVYPVGSGGLQSVLPAVSLVIGFGPGASAAASPAVPGREDSTLVIATLDMDMSGVRQGFGRNVIALKSEPFGLVPQWEVTYGARITAAPVVDDQTGTVFLGSWTNASDPSRGGRLYRLRASNGQSAWPGGGYVRLPGGVIKSGLWFERSRRILYFGTSNGLFHGINATDGSPAFAATRLDGAAGAFEATPVAAGGQVWIGSHSGRFYAIPASDPAAYRVYVSPDRGAFDASPSASGGIPGRDVVVVGSASGRVVAFPVE